MILFEELILTTFRIRQPVLPKKGKHGVRCFLHKSFQLHNLLQQKSRGVNFLCIYFFVIILARICANMKRQTNVCLAIMLVFPSVCKCSNVQQRNTNFYATFYKCLIRVQYIALLYRPQHVMIRVGEKNLRDKTNPHGRCAADKNSSYESVGKQEASLLAPRRRRKLANCVHILIKVKVR